MRVGIATDHGGFELKERLLARLRAAGYDVRDFGATSLAPADDYPDYAQLLARAVASGEVDRGIAVCGSGVGISVAANKIRGVRACLIHEDFSARQGVEDDAMNVICFGGRVMDESTCWRLTQIFLTAKFSGAERHERRLAKVKRLEEER